MSRNFGVKHNLGCGHCNRPLEDCDCGVDYEIAWLPGEIDMHSIDRMLDDDHGRFWFAVIRVNAAVALALAAIVVGFIVWGDF